MKIQNSIPQILSRAIGAKFFFILPLSISLCFTSCDESSVVGLDVQPENDLLNVEYQDTTSIITRTLKGDSLITDETLISSGIGLIGKYVDPVFGTATASMYTQVRLPSAILSNTFGTLPVCDSIVLSLVYDGVVYGKTDRKNQTLNVYQIAEDMSTSTVYYSNKTLSLLPGDLTEDDGFVFKPRPLDSVQVFDNPTKPELKPQILAHMDVAFGQLLLNNQTTGNLANNTAFQSFFKGIYITTENTTGLASEEGNIVHFKMGESKITLYYHNSTSGTATSLKYDLGLGSVARFNNFKHDYTAIGVNPDLAAQVGTSGASQNATVFVQGMSGTKTKITFPYLMNWINDGMIGINKAELLINVDTNLLDLYRLDTFAAPTNLLIFGINDDGTTYAIPDAFEGSTYFGGSLNTGTVQYKFNIARYVQQVLTGTKNNNGLYILASNGAGFANRVVIAGASSTTRPMKLNITYTKLH